MSRFSRTAANWAVAAFLALLIVAVAGIATARAEESGPGGDHLVVSRISAVSTAQGVALVRVNGAGTSDGANWSLPGTVNATAGSIGFATLRDAEAEAAPTLRPQNNGFAPIAEASFASKIAPSLPTEAHPNPPRSAASVGQAASKALTAKLPSLVSSPSRGSFWSL